MMDAVMLSQWVRIILRSVAWFLIGRGWTEESTSFLTDDQIIGGITVLLTEGWFILSQWYEKKKK